MKAEMHTGEVFTNSQGRQAKIVSLSGKKSSNGAATYLIQFLDTGEISDRDFEYGNLRKGCFKNYSRPTVYGVGVSYRGAKKSAYRVYKMWVHMLERCYNPTATAYRRYGGNGVRVCDRWLRFKDFEADIKELPGYASFLSDSSNHSLDKDIRGDGKLYSKETCMFATAKEQSHAQERVKPIRAIDQHGNELVFRSKYEACEALGVKNGNLYKVLNGERKHTRGYRFEVIAV